MDLMPAEVICTIFSTLKDIYPTRHSTQYPSEAASDTHLQRLGSLVATFVSRRWRSVALNYTALWSDLPLHLGPEWLHLFVKRSKDALLTYDDVGAGAKDRALLTRDEACMSVVPTQMYRLQ